MSGPKDLKALYQALIMEHGKSPRNEGALANTTHEHTLHNPLCGDRVSVRLTVEDGRITTARFEARGCMIAKASASIMTEAVAGKSIDDARALAAELDRLAMSDAPPADAGALEPLRGVRDFPARRACVTLAWQALARALDA